MGCSSSVPGGGRNGPNKKGKVIFSYWNFRGGPRGNSTRYLLQYCGVAYQEKNYVLGADEWGTFKESKAIPFANLPHIIDGKYSVTETLAVQQYIAAKYKPELLGSTPQEKAKAYQMLTIVYSTIVDKIMGPAITSDDKEACASSAIEGLRPIVEHLGDKPFLCGDKPTLADFQLFEGIEYTNATVADDQGGACRTYQEYPTLEEYRNRMAELPKLKQYLASQQHTKAPWYPPFAKLQIGGDAKPAAAAPAEPAPVAAPEAEAAPEQMAVEDMAPEGEAAE